MKKKEITAEKANSPFSFWNIFVQLNQSRETLSEDWPSGVCLLVISQRIVLFYI